MSDNAYLRICDLLNKIKVGASNNAEIKGFAGAISAGCDIVNEKFLNISNQFFFDSMGQYGIEKYCSLFGLKEYDEEELRNSFSKSSENYVYNDYRSLYSRKYVPGGSCKCKKFVTTVTLGDNDFNYLKKAVEYLNTYLCPGVIAEYGGGGYSFDDLDSFDFNANEWDYLATASFSFIDSLGGV